MIVLANMLDVWDAAMWRASCQGGLAVIAVWIVCWLVPSIPSRFQCWLWRLALLKFLVAMVWTTPIELPLLPAPQLVARAPSEPLLASVAATAGVLFDDHKPSQSIQPLLILFVVWVVVVLWQMARILTACRHARRLRNDCRACINGQLLDPLRRFSKLVGLTPPPPVLEIDGSGSPLLVGILRPAIVLPTDTLSRLDAAEQELVIAHELAHVGRRDLLCSLVAAIIRAVFFFHPLVWFGERRLGLIQEVAADELAIALQKQNPVRYASLLVSIVSKLGPARTVPAMSAGAVGAHSSLKQRLSAMRLMKPVSARIVLAYGLVLGLIAVLGLVPWTVVEETAYAADQAAPKETTLRGKFVSFKDGVLKVKVQDDRSDVMKESEWKVADETKIVSHIRGIAKEGTARDAFKLWEPEAVIAVKLKDDKVVFVEIGIKQPTDKVPDRRPDAAPAKVVEKVDQKTKTERGKFVSFKDGTLTIKANSGDLLANKIPENTKTLIWNNSEGKYTPAETAAVLSQAKVGTWFMVGVANENVTIRVGARKGTTTGTFVSYKNDRLLMLGKDLGESYTKKYGNNLHFNKFSDEVTVYESIDGGDYKLIGSAKETLPNVKEGTIITVHGEGDDNITLIQIGVPKKK